MTRRSRAREVALQLLVQYDFNPKVDRVIQETFVRERLLNEPDLQTFCFSLFDGVQAHRAAIDAKLTSVAENWRLPRMAAVDRNVLRMGVFEIAFADVPAPPAINEAIELARRYGSKDSPSFVNGLLDRIANPKPPEAPTPPAEEA